MTEYRPGQRWISEAEPELGLGLIVDVSPRILAIHFGAADVTRRYAAHSAPLKRARFQVGDWVRGAAGDSAPFEILRVEEQNGLCFYHGSGIILPESELSPRLSYDSPKVRLAAGQADPVAWFDLRCRTLHLQHRVRQSPVRGFLGGRVEPIAHQFYIAHEVAARQAPRVLLADETGLGKTIEACLILHRLLLSGRVARVLILVPESLVHQWFVELLRRFNLSFKIFDEARCQSIENHAAHENPFLDEQLIISALGLAEHSKRAGQIAAAPWDLLIVDEAHHIEEDTPAYKFMALLAGRIPRLLLLTATPNQLGPRNHFARLRLLDPKRYFDLERYLDEVAGYQRIAGLAGQLDADQPLPAAEAQAILELLPPDLISGDRPCTAEQFARALRDDPRFRDQVLERLIDRHGTGRVMLRNTRRTVKGLPVRRVHLIPLDLDVGGRSYLNVLADTFAAESAGPRAAPVPDFGQDPRVAWLVTLLKSHRQVKLLLICHSVAKARAVNRALARQIRVATALFHENMTLLQRDRNAAWFSRPDGARILICSEIGSEGRNFQFAQHLVLFDLPLDPEVLEQRIGRLDRVGQQGTIHIHVPYIRGSVQEVLARWYHEGLDALGRNFPGGHQALAALGGRVRTLAVNFDPDEGAQTAALERLIADTAIFRENLAAQLRSGRDRLLELCACRPGPAARILKQVAAAESDGRLDHFMGRIFAHYGIEVEEPVPHIRLLKPNLRYEDAFPGFHGEPMEVTFDRATAIANEHLGFLTWDHPMVTGAMDLLLGSPTGNCALAVWRSGEYQGIILETVYILECVAPAQLHGDRFLPATPLRVVVDQRGAALGPGITAALARARLADLSPKALPARHRALGELTRPMLTAAQSLAEADTRKLVAEALVLLDTELNGEIGRLQDLARVNPNIREAEIALARKERDLLGQAISAARLRLDALRLIFCEPPA